MLIKHKRENDLHIFNCTIRREIRLNVKEKIKIMLSSIDYETHSNAFSGNKTSLYIKVINIPK